MLPCGNPCLKYFFSQGKSSFQKNPFRNSVLFARSCQQMPHALLTSLCPLKCHEELIWNTLSLCSVSTLWTPDLRPTIWQWWWHVCTRKTGTLFACEMRTMAWALARWARAGNILGSKLCLRYGAHLSAGKTAKLDVFRHVQLTTHCAFQRQEVCVDCCLTRSIMRTCVVNQRLFHRDVHPCWFILRLPLESRKVGCIHNKSLFKPFKRVSILLLPLQGFGIHHALNPDPYRGRFGNDGKAYAQDVEDLIQAATPGQVSCLRCNVCGITASAACIFARAGGLPMLP